MRAKNQQLFKTTYIMKTEIDIETWNRKELFSFFKDFEEPFYGVCVNVDCTETYRFSKKNGYSFFLLYMHKSLQVANQLDAFKYRMEGDKVVKYDTIHASTTVLRPDNTFGFADLEFDADYDMFEEKAKASMRVVRNERILRNTQFENGVIHYSAVPWVHFTSMSHARRYSIQDSCPKISFGKVVEEGGRMLMPVSIHVHHALMDGFTVGEYIDLFQGLLAEKTV